MRGLLQGKGKYCERKYRPAGILLNGNFVIYFRLKSRLFTYLFTYIFTYLLSPWCRVLHVKLIVFQLVKLFPQFCGSRMFITAFTRVDNLSLLWAGLFESMHPSHFPNIHFNIIHPSMPVSCQWFLSLTFPHQNRVCTSPFPHTCYMPRVSHSPWYDHDHDHVISSISLHF